MKLKLTTGYNIDFNSFSRIGAIILKNFPKDVPTLSKLIGMHKAKLSIMLSIMRSFSLIKDKMLELTDFGNIVFAKDIFFEKDQTLWQLHYNISTKPYVIVWNNFINNLVYEFDELDSSELNSSFNYLSNEYSEATINKYIKKEIKSILDVYTNQGLKKINFLIKNSSENVIRVNEFPIIPDINILSSIYLYKEINYKYASSIEVVDLYKKDNSPGRIFHISEIVLRNALERLNNTNLISLESRANLDQVRLKTDLSFIDIVKKFYEQA